MAGFSYKHWKAKTGYPEFVYVTGPSIPKLRGKRCPGDKIAWTSEDADNAQVQAIVDANLPHIAGWGDLLRLANTQPTGTAGPTMGGNSRATRSRNPAWTPQSQVKRDSPYGPADTAVLNPATMSHPIPEETVLLVDHREPKEIAMALSCVPNLIVEVTTLEIGDYMVPGRFVIERKTTHDFHTSVSEDAKRMFTQTMNMANLNIPALILIEGGACAQQRLTLNSIRGTQTYLSLIQNIPIIETIDQTDTVYTIAKAVRHVCHGLGYDLGLRAMAPKKAVGADPVAAASYVLEGISGVSAARARALLAVFGSIRAVANASVEDLMNVQGVGPGTARKIIDTLGGANPAS